MDIAVVIPCFESGATIGEAVASVLVQTRPASEIVVVDDGSTGLSTGVALSTLPPLVRVLRIAHGGAGAARNRGANCTTSPHLLFLDADDLLDPTYLEKAGACLDGEPDLHIVSSSMQAFGEASYVWTPPPCTLPAALTGATIPVTALIRRTVWDTVGGFDERLPAAMDLDFWITAFEHGFRGRVLPEPLLKWRVRRDSLHHTSVSGGDHLRVMRTIFTKHRDAIERLGCAVLSAKVRFIADQYRHTAHLLARRSALRAELSYLDGQIAEAVRVRG
jgi:glycosyltransferase involved in cell wall biosynthesis